ncbi:MAG: lysophospholipid acyltransferase family protein [Ilumatobacteraceae bacterium]
MTAIDTRLAGKSLGDRIVYQLVRNLLFVLMKVWCRLRIEGRENIPRSGAFVLAPTHRSIIDTPVASAVARRRLRFMGADKWWKNKPFGKLLTALGGFPVTRGTADREAIKRCLGVLDGAEPLVLFPEGERKSGPIVEPLMDGAVYIAFKAGVPIVPVGIGGSEKAMPKGARFIHPHKMVAIVGEPIHPPVTETGRVDRVAMRDVTVQLHDELQRLYDLAQIKAGG